MRCGICNKEFKGKIGVGVHMNRSHTASERGAYYLACVTDIIPLLAAVISFAGAVQMLRSKGC